MASPCWSSSRRCSSSMMVRASRWRLSTTSAGDRSRRSAIRTGTCRCWNGPRQVLANVLRSSFTTPMRSGNGPTTAPLRSASWTRGWTKRLPRFGRSSIWPPIGTGSSPMDENGTKVVSHSSVLASREGMVAVPGGRFRMGADDQYPEEAPAHWVEVDDFWIDTHPVTNAEFAAFVEATGHVTFAEVPPRAEDYPGALPEMLYAGSLVFKPTKGP